MDILKSYAHQVVSYHPEKGRDELFAELYDELCEEFADWQAEHPDGDEAAFLDAEKDHPMRFATSLAPEGSAYLIGPQFYYSFISALKIATVVTIGVHLLIGVIPAVASGSYFQAMMRLMMAVPGTLLWVYACILGVFIAMEKSGEKASWLDNWSASKLLPIDSHRPISKSETFFDLGISLVWLLWLLDIIEFPGVVFHDGAWVTGWTVNLPGIAWVVLGIVLVLDIAYSIIRLVKAYWTPRLRLTSIAFNIAWIALLSYLAAQAPLISGSEIEVAGIDDLQILINRVTSGVLYFIVAILAIDTLKHCWRLMKPNRKILGGRQSPA